MNYFYIIGNFKRSMKTCGSVIVRCESRQDKWLNQWRNCRVVIKSISASVWNPFCKINSCRVEFKDELLPWLFCLFVSTEWCELVLYKYAYSVYDVCTCMCTTSAGHNRGRCKHINLKHYSILPNTLSQYPGGRN